MKYKLICMSFDGEYKTERPEFENKESAWIYSNNIGSKWYFYPFHFLVTKSGKTIKDCAYPLDIFIGSRVDRVAKIFNSHSMIENSQGLDPNKFAFSLMEDYYASI